MERRSLTFLKLGILFCFFNFNVEGMDFIMDFMPDFAGMLFLFASIASHDMQTETEKRLKPLLLLLAADYFLHWIIPFENSLESLLSSVISVYVTFMLMGEVVKRIQPEQPERARHLNAARMGTVFFLTLNFLLSAYDNNILNGVLVVFFLSMLISLMVVVCRIRPCGEQERGRSCEKDAARRG